MTDDPQPKANKTDAGDGAKAICRVGNVLRSLSPDPKLSPENLTMPRRRELKSLASGMATFCVCRNNDIGGYWGLGVLCKHAQEISVAQLFIEILSDDPVSAQEQAVRDNLRVRFRSQRRNLPGLARAILVTFAFEPYAKSDLRGMRFRGTCTVCIKDDLGIARSASASQLCYPHNPKFEHKSTRVEQGSAD